MSPRAMVAVIEHYEVRLQEAGIPKKRIDPSRSFSSLSVPEILAHAHFICDGVKEYAASPDHLGKANRHLTVVQMCLSFAGWYTLEELMEHNRPVAD